MVENRIDAAKKLLMSVGRPKLEGIPYREYPECEVLGVPQRAYGYVTPEIKDRYDIDKLQTTNVLTCVAFTGHNERGAFLVHLDDLVAKESPEMMGKLTRLLGYRFHFHVFSTPIHKKEQEYVPWLMNDLLKRYAIDIVEHQKGGFQFLRIGISVGGELFHPENDVKDDSLYGEENRLFMGALPEEITYRTNLVCINEMKGLV